MIKFSCGLTKLEDRDIDFTIPLDTFPDFSGFVDIVVSGLSFSWKYDILYQEWFIHEMYATNAIILLSEIV